MQSVSIKMFVLNLYFNLFLDSVEGIGPKRRKMLLKRVWQCKTTKAQLEQLERVLPHEVALNLFNVLKADTEK